MRLYGDLLSAFIAVAVVIGYCGKIGKILVAEDNHTRDNNSFYGDNELWLAAMVTSWFATAAVARTWAVVGESRALGGGLVASRLALLLGLLAIGSMNEYQWPVQGHCTVTPQCKGTIFTVVANVSLPFGEKAWRILLVLCVGSFVSVRSPHSIWAREYLPSIGTTALVSYGVIGLQAAVQSAQWGKIAKLRKRVDLLTVHGSRIVLAAVFLQHLWRCVGTITSPVHPEDNAKGGEQAIFALVQAAVVAAMGIAATGTFSGEISKKEQLESLVQQRTLVIRQTNKSFRTVNMALQASETAIAITDYGRSIVWCNASLERLATGTKSDNSRLLLGRPLVDVLEFQTKQDRCYLAGAFDASTRRQDEVCIAEKVFHLEVSPFAEEEDDHDDDKVVGTCTLAEDPNHKDPKQQRAAPTVITQMTNRRFLVVFKDITADRARAAAEHTAREKATMAKAMGDSMVTLTHELRTPLQGIMGITSLLLKGTEEDEDEDEEDDKSNCKDATTEFSSDALESLKLIMASSSLLLNLINNLLDVKKATAKMLEEFPLAPILAATPIKDAVVFCQPLASISNVELVSDFSSVPNATVRSNALRLQQVLINLISNAIKYTERGSRIVVGTRLSTAREVRCRMDGSLACSRDAGCDSPKVKDDRSSCDNDDAVLVFSVSDCGPGIASNQAHRLFCRFAQLDNKPGRTLGSTKTGQPSGTGLGLHLCQLFVQRMDGHIWATNNKDQRGGGVGEQGKGSTFWFFLPLSSNGLSPSPGHVHDVAVARKVGRGASQYGTSHRGANKGIHSVYTRRVLLVDDTLINRKVLSRILKKIGFSEVTVVDSGENALAELLSKDQDQYDLVISDIQMPGMSGTELSRAIEVASSSSSGHFRRPVVIGLTADTSPDVAGRCRSNGMSDVLYKPVTVEGMMQYAEQKIPMLQPGTWNNVESMTNRHGCDEQIGLVSPSSSLPTQ